MADSPRQAKLRKIGVYLLSAAFILWGIIALASGRFRGAGGVLLSTIGLGLILGGLVSVIRLVRGTMPSPPVEGHDDAGSAEIVNIADARQSGRNE